MSSNSPGLSTLIFYCHYSTLIWLKALSSSYPYNCSDCQLNPSFCDICDQSHCQFLLGQLKCLPVQMRGFYCTNSFVKFDYAHLNICMKQTLSICVHTRAHADRNTHTHTDGRNSVDKLCLWLVAPYIFNPLGLQLVVIIDLPQLCQNLTKSD